MRSTATILGCVLLAICLSRLPGSDGQACTAPGVPVGCTDCTDPANAASPDCVTTEAPTTVADTTVAGDTTTAAAGDTTTAASADTTTTASTGGTKTKTVKKISVTISPGKKTITRRRKGGKKAWLFNKFGNPAPPAPPTRPTSKPVTIPPIIIITPTSAPK